MKDAARKISSAVFAIVIICFFMPFMEVSCSGSKVMSLTGIQMATGTTIQQPSMFGETTKSEKIDPNPFALGALILTGVGLIMGFLRQRKTAIVSALCAGASVIALLIMKAQIDNEVLKEGGGMIVVEFSFGFWAALMLFIVAIALNVFAFTGNGEP